MGLHRGIDGGQERKQAVSRPGPGVEVAGRSRLLSCHDHLADGDTFIADMKATGSGGELGNFLVRFAAERAVEGLGHSGTSVRTSLTVRKILIDVKIHCG
jgi:hypothetical protein